MAKSKIKDSGVQDSLWNLSGCIERYEENPSAFDLMCLDSALTKVNTWVDKKKRQPDYPYRDDIPTHKSQKGPHVVPPTSVRDCK